MVHGLRNRHDIYLKTLWTDRRKIPRRPKSGSAVSNWLGHKHFERLRMVTMPGSYRTLADSWGEVVTRQGFNAAQGGKKRSQSAAYTPTKKALRKPRGALERRWSTQENALRKYKASVAKMVAREEAPIGVQPVPDMDSWALIHGVVDFSETTKSRGFEINEGRDGTKRYVNPAPVHAATPRGEEYAKAHRRAASFTRRRRCALPTVERQSCPVPEVEALEGFLSEMQNRLSFLEEGAVRTGPAPTSALSKRNYPSAGMDTTALSGPVDVFGIPQRLMENVEEARRRWEGHRDNLEMRDKDFLDGFRRIARMASSQILIARIWRGHRILKKYSKWKKRRQRKCKANLCAWLMVVKANMLYTRNLKRFGFGNWNDMAQEDRNTRVVGIRALEATVMKPRLTRQAVVRFFEEGDHLTDGLSLEEASNRASMKRKISKILFDSWRDEVHAYQRSVAQGAFRISKAARLQTVSTILWAPEWVSLLFHMWSRMAKFSRAVRQRTKIPTFPVEEGNESFPEWDSWVTDRGRRMLLNREALQRGGKIFLHNKFRRWAAFARWYMAQDERVKDATQASWFEDTLRYLVIVTGRIGGKRFSCHVRHYDHYKMNQVFNAWAKMARERGSMMRRVSRYWAGWRYVSTRRQRTKALRDKVEKHVRLLRIGAVMEEMKAITRDRKIMAAFAVSKLLLTQALIGGSMLSYTVTGQSAHFVALLAWQAWKSFAAKRRRWKWLLYQHSKTEALHAKQAILRAWSFITRRHRPDDLSPTLSASLPFSTWDRFIRSYVDRGIIPRNQLHKDMVSRGVMQQNNTWWLVNRNIGDDSRDSRSAGSRGCSADGTARGYVESQSCGSSAWERRRARKRLDQFVNSSRSKEKVASVTDWRTLGPALFKAIDECDVKGVSNLLRRGAQVNAIHVPPDDTADSLWKGKGRVQGLFANTDERTGDVTGSTSALRYNLDLQAPTLVHLSDGTFEVRGSTPLHVAACRLSADFLPIVILLLHAGAWVDALDSAGKTPQQLCTSPQIAALLHKHRERLHAFKFSSRELCWGQEVLTSEDNEVGGEALWRYITRVAILSKIEELHAILRLENKRAEDAQTEAQGRPSSGATTGKSFEKSHIEGSECITEMGSLDVDPEEREKELIRMRIERLEGARAILEREHALHGRRLMTDGGGGGRGEEMDMLFDDLDQAIMEKEGSTPLTKATRNRRTSESPDDDDIGICSGKGHTVDEIRKAFLCRRMEAANWFQRFRDTLLRVDLLGIPERSKGLKRSRAGCSEEDTDRLLAVLEGSARGIDAAASAGVEKFEWSVCGSKPSKPALAGLRCGRMNSSGTDAFNLVEANDCWEALETVLDRRRKVVSDRFARDKDLIERGTWGELERVIITDQEANVECAANPPRVWTRHEVCGKSPVMNPRQADGREMEPILPSTSFDYSVIKAAESSRTEEGNIGVEQMEGKEAGVLERFEDERQLVIHVIPTSASQRCHWASVAIRGTCEHQVLAGGLSMFEIWRTGNENGKASRSEKEAGNAFFEKGVLSRIPKAWWGSDGERVLDLMLQERRKLFRKREKLTSHARELEIRLASVAENLQELKNRENEIGTTVRKVAAETRKSEMIFRQDMERWLKIMQQANTKVGSISRKRAIVTDETSALEDTLASWDSREQPTTAERSMRKKNDGEEITRETLQRDIKDKRELVSKLDGVEKQSKKAIEIATQKLNEGRVFLAQVQAILAKYSSYSMRKMETLEEEFKLCSKQKEDAMDVQALVVMQLQAESRRLEELEKGIGILQEAGVVVPQPARSSSSADNLGRSNDISFPRQCEEVINGDVDRAAGHGKDGSHCQDEDAGRYPVLDGDDTEKPLGHVDGTAIAPDDGALSPESARVGSNSHTDECVSSLDLLKNGEISGSSSREGKESAVVSLLCLIHENAIKMQADSQPFYRGISQRGKKKPLRLKSPEKDAQEGLQTCEASGPSNVHSCRGDSVRMNEGTLLLEEACGVMEEGQPSEVGKKAAPDSREAQEEERRKRWEEEDEDEQAAWLAMRGGDETFEEELELTKEEISRLLQGQYKDALEHVFEPERQAALALKEGSAAARRLSACEERDQEDQTTIGEEDTSIAHLLGSSNLELTQEERETLFDLDGDEWGEIDGPDIDDGDGKVMRSREGRSRHRSRDPTSGILLFLRRCGQRRTPEDPPENPNAYGLLGNPPGHTPIVKPDLDSYISLNFVGRKGDAGQELVTIDVEQEREVEDATNNVRQDYEKGGKRQPESSENDEVGIIWRESSSRQKRGQSSMLSGRGGQGDFIDNRRLNLLYRRLGSSIDDSIENDAKTRSFDKTSFRGKSIPASPDPLERVDHLHEGQKVAISDAVVSSECMPKNLGEMGLTVSANSGQSITDNRTEQASFKDAAESSLLSSVGATASNGSEVTTCTEVDKAQASLLMTRKIAGEVLEEEEDGDERTEKSKVASGTLEEESMVVKYNKRQPWSAEERVSPTRQEMEKESLTGDSGWQRWPPSRPCNTDNRAENPSIVFDPRPPWLQPMDSVFAPRVSGSALKGYASTERGPLQHQQSKTGSTGRGIDTGEGVEKNSKNGLLLRGGSSLPRLCSDSRIAPQSAHSYARRRETGRRVGKGTEGRDSVTSLEEEANPSAQTLHRRRSASTTVLRVEKEAPGTEDDVWTWGWHEDTSQDLLQESTGILIPGVASEASTHANRTMLRRASPKRSREHMHMSHGNPVDTTSSSGCHRKNYKEAKTSNALKKRPWTTGEFQVSEDKRIECSPNRAVTAEGKRYLRAGVTQINPSEVKARGELALDDDTWIHRKADAENEGVVDSLSSQKGRRVSFADETHGRLGLEPAVYSKESSPVLEQTLSSVIFSSYPKGGNKTKSRTRRRPTIEERRRYEAEILLAARELLFSDTRPDGLRPITGCPMENGRITNAPGGLYVGLAGLRGFELPLVGAASNRNEAGHLKVLRSQPLACVGSTAVSSELSGGEPTPFTPALTASNDGPSRLVTESLPKHESEDQTETRGARKIGDTKESPKATEAFSLFAQKPAVLWSTATLSADDLVSTPSPYDRKTRPLTAKDYTSKALLAAYKRIHPVFKVEASSWHAIPEIDYAAPPARWGNPESVLPPADKEKVWKCFEALPISRAEAKALREVAISRSGDRRPFGKKGRTIQAGEPFRRQITATPYMGSDSDASCSFSSQTGSDSTPLSDMEITGDILSVVPMSLQEGEQPARNLSENVKPIAGNNQEHKEPTSASAGLPLQKSHDRSRFIRKDKAETADIVTKENLGTEQSFEEESRHQKWGMEANTLTADSSQMISRHSGVIATEEVLSAAHRDFPGDLTLIPTARNALASSIVSTSRGPCYLRSEVDVDNALRTMMRLSNSDGESYEAHLSSIQQFCPTFITDIRERLWRRERELSLAPTTRGVKRGVLSRGGTRAINGTRRGDTQATNAQHLTLEGQKLGSKKRVYQRLPRPCERRSPPQGRYVPGGDGGKWTESGNVQGRSAPGLGQRESSGRRITMEAMNNNLSSFKVIGNRPSSFTATTKSSRPPSCQHPELLNGSKYMSIDAKRCVGRGDPSSTSEIPGHVNNQRPYRSSRNPTAVPRGERLDEPIRDVQIAGVVNKDNTKVNWSMTVESTEPLGSSMALTTRTCPITNGSTYDGMPVEPLDGNKTESKTSSQSSSGSKKPHSLSKELLTTISSGNMRTSVERQDNEGSRREKPREVKSIRQIDGQSPTAVVLPRLTKGGAAMETTKAQECGDLQRQIFAAEVKDSRVSKINEGGDRSGDDGKLPPVEHDSAHQRIKTGADGNKGEGDVGLKRILVRTRPQRVESKDLETTTEALTTHHLSIDELLQTDEEERPRSSGHGGYRARHRKEPVILTQAVRTKDMAYWKTEEAKEQERLCRLHSTAKTAVSEGGEASTSNCQHIEDATCSLGLANRSEEEKDEVRHLLPIVRKRRLSRIAKVRTERHRQTQSAVQLNNKSVVASTVNGDSSPTGSASNMLRATKDGSELALANSGAGASTAAAISAENNAEIPGTEGTPGTRHRTETAFLGTQSKQEEKGVSPWKGFQTNEEEEAMLKRRQPRAQGKEPTTIKSVDEWERQLLVPEAEDNLVNFHVDSSAIQSKFGRLRRGVKIRDKTTVDEDAQDISDGDR